MEKGRSIDGMRGRKENERRKWKGEREKEKGILMEERGGKKGKWM